MCLAVAGRILSIQSAVGLVAPDRAADGAAAVDGPQPADAEDSLWRQAEVDFGGVRQQVSLACLPEARVGDRVLVHVGLALSLVLDDGPVALQQAYQDASPPANPQQHQQTNQQTNPQTNPPNRREEP
jgi:hydrogenase expression/formation protein HypC